MVDEVRSYGGRDYESCTGNALLLNSSQVMVKWSLKDVASRPSLLLFSSLASG